MPNSLRNVGQYLTCYTLSEPIRSPEHLDVSEGVDLPLKEVACWPMISLFSVSGSELPLGTELRKSSAPNYEKVTDLEFNSWWKSASYIRDVDQAYLKL